MKTNSKPKLFRWALWWGLGIVVVSLAIIIAVDLMATLDGGGSSEVEITGPLTDFVYKFVYHFGIWPVVLYIGVIGPVFEELCFRLWGDGKQWTGFTSVALMALWAIGVGWWVAVLALAAGVAVMLLLRRDRTRRLFALMLLSSLLFAFIHRDNYEGNTFLVIVSLVDKLGFGLLASYLVINHNLLWSMALHILNNTLATIPMGVAFHMATHNETTIETADHRLALQPLLVHSQEPRGSYSEGWIDDSTLAFYSTPSYAATMLISGHDTLPCQCDWDKEYPRAAISISLKNGSRDYAAVVRSMEEAGWIAVDTLPGPPDTLRIRTTYDPLDDL